MFIFERIVFIFEHQDHWDPAAIAALDKTVPVLTQPGEGETIRKVGFTNVTEMGENISFEGTTIFRTSGRHGTGAIGKLMGHVSGFVFKSEGEPTLYIAGDTIWCEEVRQALDKHHPDMTLVNAGGARFRQGCPIIMNEDDVVSLCRYAPYTKVATIHMEAINHCFTTRADLKDRLLAEGLEGRVLIPLDGEWF
ncbi:MBL fold metallo-hydrolase [Paenibacillus sp.]|jgi:L-ascorbate metabolism protein UlaG (beta-lactamase superfamily)|uniref:MBL fold metallo-hydrolase n=1 Tax=Paenibacillus sp. TaxID=58172 RepID=UPI00282EBE40|nr:MBL fold metallo-hydrolase [Paenibacillus sp.]MDR0270803.1 MBL fold metallo-hydrolase [Paenibacillus sp.]